MNISVRAILFVALSVSGTWQTLAQKPAEKPAATITLRVQADYLALHASGSAPAGTSTLEHRLTMQAAEAQPAAWSVAPAPAADGSFKFDVPLPDWRWAKLEVRAVTGGETLATQQATPKKRALTMLTPERIAALPEAKRAAWLSYLETSTRHAEHERDVIAAECRKLGLPTSKAAPDGGSDLKMDSDVPPSWYASPGALRIADAVLSFQTPTGGWSKAVDFTSGSRSPGTHWTSNASNPWHYCGTLDNRATTEEIKLLANVHLATGGEGAKAGALRGIEWLLAAQFPNGGWPQVYPVEPGYHEAITLNDGAMQHALEVLQSVSKREPPFTFVDAALSERARIAFDRGVACLLECQVQVGGKRTVWCAQHDPLSLEPVAARLKEPPSLSGGESGDLLRFLMRKGPTTPEVIHSIQSGIDWFASHRITNLRQTKDARGKTDYVPDAESGEIRWARFYDVQTGHPIFAGAQDGKVYGTFHEMAQHNSVGYAYFTTRPAEVIGKEQERWQERLRVAQ